MMDDPTLPVLAAPSVTLGPLCITDDGQVTLRGEPVELARRELALLRALVSQPDSVVTKDRLLHNVLAFSRATTRQLDSTAVTLRRKLRPTNTDRWIKWVWGVGYALHDGPIPPA
jgi:DNA-binding response OmpR family regulator